MISVAVLDALHLQKLVVQQFIRFPGQLAKEPQLNLRQRLLCGELSRVEDKSSQ